MPTMGEMTVLADPPAGRPDVAVVRQPIADERHASSATSCCSAASASLARLRDRRQGDLRAARRRVRRHRPRGRSPAATPPGCRSPATSCIEIGPPPVRPDRAVLQIAAYAARDDLLAVLQQLGRSGYTIALDDFDGRGDVESLLGLCSIVKVRVDGPRRRHARRDPRRPEAPRRAARRHRRRDARGLRALPRARLLLLPGRLLRQAARRHATAASAPAASPRCARSAS